MLRVEHLKIGSLPPLSFEVAEGRCLAVEGPSGSGKSRLLRAIADLDDAAGQIFLDGHERWELPAPQWRRMVRYAAAEPAWWSDTPRAAFPSQPDASERSARVLASLGLDETALDQTVATLSTGERPRLALARALADEPKVLLLDEPTSALDVRAAALAEELIRYQLLAGRIVLLASHDGALIQRLAHERLILERPRPAGASRDLVPPWEVA
ncbi:MAG: ABC transporter ATP-binding protein [Hyphomicrobium sp.]